MAHQLQSILAHSIPTAAGYQVVEDKNRGIQLYFRNLVPGIMYLFLKGTSSTTAVQVPRPLSGTFQHARCRARKMLVGHRPVAIFRTPIWLLSGETGSSSLGDLF